MNRTKMIYDKLMARLDSGAYPPESKFPSESTLADEFGVSKLTINKVVAMIAESGRLVRGKSGAGTRVAKYRFQPKGNLIFLGPLNSYTLKAINGIQSECMYRGYFPVVFDPRGEEIAHCLQMINRSNAIGIVSMQLGLLPPVEELNMIFLDYSLPHIKFRPHLHYLNSDNFAGAKELMQEILEKGHREIVLFSNENYSMSPPLTIRIQAFQEVMASAGIRDCRERTFFCASQTLRETRTILQTILRNYPETTIICADTDYGTDLLHSAAESMGINCTKDLCLTGFGNVSELPITTVDQNPELQGKLAARYLIDFAEGKRSDKMMIDELIPATPINSERIPILRRAPLRLRDDGEL